MTDFGQRRRVLPKTGQTTSYRNGDDGYYEKGWDEAERFKDVGDGTVIDNATGLMWPKDWAGDGGNGGNALNWNSAIDWAEALDFAGHTDWRLPNINELSSLIALEATPPLVYDFFENVITGEYFTSSTDKRWANSAYIFTIDYGYFAYGFKFSSYYLVAVRDA